MAHPPKQRKVIDIKAVGDAEGKVYPRSVDGPFTRWRWVFVWLTQLVFYGLCWIPWDGRQAVLFDLDARKFYLFDLVLWPQDTIYLVMLMIVGALALFLFTAVAGRLWCGYSCPQTVYTEIFLWIEKRIEGERPQRIKLDGQPWSARKLAIKGAKHLAWGVFALWTGITFVGYFVPIRELVGDLLAFSAGPWASFWAVFYAFATYGNAGFLRDQMCRQICPYARFQFVMLDPDTLIIAYDSQRGDARGARPKGVDPQTLGLGDCVDCGICVQVCPTGIDIRNGLQNECIGCAACIDACDQVMDKMNYPRGLIRYSTENAIAQRYTLGTVLRRALRPRVLVYAALLIGLTLATAWSLATRPQLRINVQKDRNVLSREADDGRIENSYQLQILNAGHVARSLQVTLDGRQELALGGAVELTVPAGESASTTVVVRAEPGSLPAGSNAIDFTVRDAVDPAIEAHEKSKFWMP
ncbi:cytochrome c oxidase accessory protein CcoG [Azonexus sp. R2A61]|uniref:cytochrome c oxidase accessory protein CcoG n=1 Tax=Azonexus sp. R2A61 TaxID=2744443 RepID=UPI001F2998BE|nr:cytochrome c oxidase accessory protein CcoG [Azonexus sp. R2A61]